MHRWLIQGLQRRPRWDLLALFARLAAGAIFVGFGLGKFVRHDAERDAFERYEIPFPDDRDVPRRRSGTDRRGGLAARLVRAPLRLPAGLQHDRSDHHGRTRGGRPGAPAAGAGAAGGHPVPAVGGCRGRVPRWSPCLPTDRCSLTAGRSLPPWAYLRGERADAAPIGRPAVTSLMTRRPPLMDEVAAATSRDGLRQIDRHTLHRRVEAHQRTRGHQHQQHQRQVLDRRLTPLHASPPYGRKRHVRVTTGHDFATTPVGGCVR